LGASSGKANRIAALIALVVLVTGGIVGWIVIQSRSSSQEEAPPIATEQEEATDSSADASESVNDPVDSPVETFAATTTAAPTTTLPAATTTTLGPLITLPQSEVTAAASSYLPHDDDPDRYAASQTLDGKLETAWNHCGTGCSDLTGDERQGVGVRLTYAFDEPVELTAIRIANGYQKIHDSLGDVWPKNNRIASLEIRTENSATNVTLADERGYQEITAALGVTTWVELTVTGVYYGDGTYNDLAVSEIDFVVRRVDAGA